MKNLVKIIAASVLLLAGCEEVNDPNEQSPNAGKMNVSVKSAASDSGFMNGDKVGLFVVYDDEVMYNNIDLQYDYSSVTWRPSENLYWKDSSTPADLYCYYPYHEDFATLHGGVVWNIDNQSSLDHYRNSDVLLGCVQGASPSNNLIGIRVNHVMSHLVVKLEAGNGFSAEEVSNATVEIRNVDTEAWINVGEQVVTSTGNVGSISPYFNNGQYCAHIVPCTVDNTELVHITIGDNEYSLNQTIEFESGKEYICTIKLSKADQGVNIGITDWITQSKDYGGVIW